MNRRTYIRKSTTALGVMIGVSAAWAGPGPGSNSWNPTLFGCSAAITGACNNTAMTPAEKAECISIVYALISSGAAGATNFTCQVGSYSLNSSKCKEQVGSFIDNGTIAW